MASVYSVHLSLLPSEIDVKSVKDEGEAMKLIKKDCRKQSSCPVHEGQRFQPLCGFSNRVTSNFI